MSDPIIPARVYPADTPLPPTPGGPPPPLGPDFVPPWRTAPPPPPPASPPPGPVEVHVTVDFATPPEPEPEPEGPSAWERLADWIRPRQTILGLAAAVIPYPAYGHSLATAWAATLSDARDTGSIGGAYALAGIALTIALLTNRRRTTWWARTLLATAVIGGTGALGWYDPITALTGVRP